MSLSISHVNQIHQMCLVVPLTKYAPMGNEHVTSQTSMLAPQFLVIQLFWSLGLREFREFPMIRASAKTNSEILLGFLIDKLKFLIHYFENWVIY